MNPKVTIGLCIKNGAKVVKTTFGSISLQDFPHELIKLVIVDDGSSDNTFSLATEFAQETDIPTFVTSSGGKGLGVTRQIVVNNAEGDYIVWVDDDFVISKDFIRAHVEYMEKNLKVGAARCINITIDPQDKIFNVANYDSLLFADSHNLNSIGAGGSIFRLKVLKGAGGFDTRIKGAGEDVDVSRRIRESGLTLEVNSSAKLYKKDDPMTLKAIWKKNFWYGYGNHFLLHKYTNQQVLLGYFPPMVLWVGIKFSYLIYRLTNRKKAFVFTIFHSFAMLSNYIGFMRAHLDGYGH